jgi:hypothetical protein
VKRKNLGPHKISYKIGCLKRNRLINGQEGRGREEERREGNTHVQIDSLCGTSPGLLPLLHGNQARGQFRQQVRAVMYFTQGFQEV